MKIVDRIFKRLELINSAHYLKYWSLVVTLSDSELNMMYVLENIEIQMTRDVAGLTYQEIQGMMRDFIIDIYYEYEWDGRQMSFESLCPLLGTTRKWAFVVVEGIMNKIKNNRGMLR